MRGWLTIVFAALSLEAGCEKAKVIACGRSLGEECARPTRCALTWEEAQIDTRFCQVASTSPPARADCGGTHVVTITYQETSRSYYYDAASGMLIAVVTANGLDGTTTCAGSAAGFTLPVCSGGLSEPLPQCLDGGADAAAAG